MILSKTPLRISFFGGGTDIPAYFNESYGLCIGCSIEVFTYAQLYKPKLNINSNNRFTVSYSNKQSVSKIDLIDNVIIREALRKYRLLPLNITSEADVLKGSGMGGSSSFCISLVLAIQTYLGKLNTASSGSVKFNDKLDIIKKAVDLELIDCNSKIGIQDHYLSGLGGMNIINITKEKVVIQKLNNDLPSKILNNLFLVAIPGSHQASEILTSMISQSDNFKLLDNIKDIAIKFSKNPRYDENFHELMKLSWENKVRTSKLINNKIIDDAIQLLKKNGAKSWKIFGAGGAGFLGAFFKNSEELKYAKKKLNRKLNIFNVEPNFSGMKVYDFR